MLWIPWTRDCCLSVQFLHLHSFKMNVWARLTAPNLNLIQLNVIEGWLLRFHDSYRTLLSKKWSLWDRTKSISIRRMKIKHWIRIPFILIIVDNSFNFRNEFLHIQVQRELTARIWVMSFTIIKIGKNVWKDENNNRDTKTNLNGAIILLRFEKIESFPINQLPH